MKNKKALVVLLLVVGLVYANNFFAGFVSDDKMLIVEKQAFFSHPGSSIKILALSDAPLGEKTPYYRPVNTLSYMLDHYLWGLHPFWYHLENILLHALVVMLFYLLLMEVFEDGRLAFLAALLFAVYPVNAEAVDLISARNTLLCAAFSLFSLLLLSKRGFKWTILSLLSYILALMSKEPAVIIPFFLFSLRFTVEDRKLKIKNGALAGFLGITALYFVLRHVILGTFTSKGGIDLSIERLKLISSVYFENFRLFVFPFKLNAFYIKRSMPFSVPKAVVAVSAMLLLLYFSLKKKVPGQVRAGAQWVLWGLLPASYIVNIPSPPVAERFQYTILPGFVIMIAYLLAGLQKRRMLAGAAVTAVVVLGLGIRTVERNFIWHDDLSLCTSEVRSDPGNRFARCNLGLAFEKRGILEQAAQECGAAVRMNPDYGEAYVCLGLVYARQGLTGASMAAFQKAAQVTPDLKDAHMNLAVAYAQGNRPLDAEREFLAVISLNPYDVGAHIDLAELYLRQNRMKEAGHELQTVLQLEPDDASAHSGLGLIYASSGNIEGAVREFGKALVADPSLLDARLNLGVAYAKEGRFEDAAGEFQGVLKRDPGNAQAIEYLNKMKAMMGGR